MKVEGSQYTSQNHLPYLNSKRLYEGIKCKEKEEDSVQSY